MLVELDRNWNEWGEQVDCDLQIIETRDRLVTRPAVKARPKTAPSFILKTPDWYRVDPPWWLIEVSVLSCQGVFINEEGRRIGNYCVLAQAGINSYVQTAFCPEAEDTWRLEWRITELDGSYIHCFAHRPDDKDYPDTMRDIKIVQEAFKAFYRNQGLPDSLAWWPYDI